MYPLPVQALAGLSVNNWPRAHVQKQGQNNAHGTIPADGSQPGTASWQPAASSLTARDTQQGSGEQDSGAGSLSPSLAAPKLQLSELALGEETRLLQRACHLTLG